MTLSGVFDELATHRSGQWPGLLSGVRCDIDGNKRTWVLSRDEPGFVVVSHVEEATSSAEADWKENALPDQRAVHEFLNQPSSGSCASYWSNFGRWGFGIVLAARNQRVREVKPLEYQASD
jgi:hypothetical protein